MDYMEAGWPSPAVSCEDLLTAAVAELGHLDFPMINSEVASSSFPFAHLARKASGNSEECCSVPWQRDAASPCPRNDPLAGAQEMVPGVPV